MGFLLFLMIFVPLVAAGVIACACRGNRELARTLALGTTLFVLFLAGIVVLGYQPRSETSSISGPIQPRMELRWNWFHFGTVSANGNDASSLQFYLGMDGISLWLVALTALLMVSAVLVSWEAIDQGAAGYYALLLLLESGMIGVFCAFDMVLFYIFFEFTLIPLFFLIGLWGGPDRQYAARKFFIYTLAGSLVLLVGMIAVVYTLHAETGKPVTFSIPQLASQMAEQMGICEGAEPIVVGEGVDPEAARMAKKEFWYSAQFWIFLAMFAGFAIKVPLFPFHTWLPLAHVEAPTAGSVLLAGVLLKLGSYGFLRICLPLLPYATWNVGVPLIASLSVMGILYGALCALAQDDIKRLVAYSSVSHLGFCMLGMFALNSEGLAGSTLQMVNHGLSTGGLFLLVGMLYERYHTRQLAEMGGLANKLPLFAVALVFISLSSVGLPGLNGFVGEVLSLIGMFKVHVGYAVLGTSGIIFGAWYLFNMLQKVLFGPLKEPHHGETLISDLKPREIVALVPIAVVCVAIGVCPRPFLSVINPDVDAVASLYRNSARLVPPGETALAAMQNAASQKPVSGANQAETKKHVLVVDIANGTQVAPFPIWNPSERIASWEKFVPLAWQPYFKDSASTQKPPADTLVAENR
ncbi:MAG: NADH-quinone oxidoreductase subunit M [Planctomycetota bacterium]